MWFAEAVSGGHAARGGAALSRPALLALTLVVGAAVSRALRRLRGARRARTAAFLAGKHVWVTGGSSGIGLAVAALAVQAGARVTVSARGGARLRVAAARVGARAVVMDVGARGGVDVGEVEEGGGVDVVVANAGVNQGGKPFDVLGVAEAERVVDVNLLGTVRTFMGVLGGMKARGGGVLCAVSSLAGYRGVPGGSVYGASKAGVTLLCQSLNVELVGSGVRAVCVHPGFVATPAIEGLDHPKPFLMSAEDAAEAVLDAIADGRRETGFPWMMENVVMRFAAAVPAWAYERILHATGDHHAVRRAVLAVEGMSGGG